MDYFNVLEDYLNSYLEEINLPGKFIRNSRSNFFSYRQSSPLLKLTLRSWSFVVSSSEDYYTVCSKKSDSLKWVPGRLRDNLSFRLVKRLLESKLSSLGFKWQGRKVILSPHINSKEISLDVKKVNLDGLEYEVSDPTITLIEYLTNLHSWKRNSENYSSYFRQLGYEPSPHIITEKSFLERSFFSASSPWILLDNGVIPIKPTILDIKNGDNQVQPYIHVYPDRSPLTPYLNEKTCIRVEVSRKTKFSSLDEDFDPSTLHLSILEGDPTYLKVVSISDRQGFFPKDWSVGYSSTAFRFLEVIKFISDSLRGLKSPTAHKNYSRTLTTIFREVDAYGNFASPEPNFENLFEDDSPEFLKIEQNLKENN